MKLFQDRANLNIRKEYFSRRVVKVWNDLPEKTVTAPNVNTFKNRLDRHWKEEEFLYNFEAAIPGLHLAEDRARRAAHVDLTIEINLSKNTNLRNVS